MPRVANPLRSLLALLVLTAAARGRAPEPVLELRDGDTIAVVGGAWVERLAAFGYFETLLRGAYPELELRVRMLGWSGDTVSLRPRPLNFGDLHDDLALVRADVVLLGFGGVEAFDGEAGLADFERGLGALVDELAARRYGDEPPRLALIAPLAYQDLGPPLPPGASLGPARAAYARAVERVARDRGLPFADLYARSRAVYDAAAGAPLTIDGLQVNAAGARLLAPELLAALGRPPDPWDQLGGGPAGREAADEVRALVVAKNREWFLRWRPVNGEYVYGRRAEPFGVVSFPPEMRALDERVAELERRITARVRATAPRAEGGR